MVRQTFNPHTIKFEDFFKKDGQSGKGYYFSGIPYQRGYGMQYGGNVGGVLNYMLRFLVPILKDAGKNVGKEFGKEALSTGARILGNLLQGEQAKQVMSSQVKEGAERLLTRVKDRYKAQRGGSLVRKKRKQVAQISRKPKRPNMFKKLHAAKKPRNTFGLF